MDFLFWIMEYQHLVISGQFRFFGVIVIWEEDLRCVMSRWGHLYDFVAL